MPTATTTPWQRKVSTFAAMYGPFTTKWDHYRSFRQVEGFLEVTWPRMESKVPPLIDTQSKPRCACCGSARPMSLRILTDRNGATHMVGEECYHLLNSIGMVKILDFVSPIPTPQ